MKPFRRPFAAVVLAVLATAACKRGPKYAFTTATSARRDITAVVSATGTLDSVVKVLIGSQVSGRLQKLYVDFNDRVKKGQVLAQIDPSSFRAKVDEIGGELAHARANVSDAERTLGRANELYKARIGTAADLDAAKTKLQLAQADVQQAIASLSQAKVDLANTTISSPIDGIVIARSVTEGQTVAASLQAPTLFTLADDLSRLQIIANVDEADVGQVAEGQDVNFTVDAFPQTVFTGKVQLIRNAPVTVQGVVTYETVVGVDNPGQKLRPGMTANAAIVVARKKGVLAVPNAALRYRPPDEFVKKDEAPREAPAPKGKQAVKKVKTHVTLWVLKEGRPEPLRVKMGVSDGVVTEIKEGLEENVPVVVATVSGARSATPDAGAGKKLLP